MQRHTRTKVSSLSASSLRQAMKEESVKMIPFFSNPLFSCLITLYSLILIYFPLHFLRILLSPVLLISGALLFSLLRLGSTPKSNTRPDKTVVNLDETEDSNVLVVRDSSSEAKHELYSDLMGDFVEWNLRAPLEVIHEAYEDEDDDDEEEEKENQSVSGGKDPTRLREIERFPSLSLCYPESDSESDSEFEFLEIGKWISPEKMGFRWEDEDDGIGGEGLIEIKLDEYKSKMSNRNQTVLDFHAEEDGLIEINLFT